MADQLEVSISGRSTFAEKEKVREAAWRCRMTPSAYVRQRLVEAAQRDLQHAGKAQDDGDEAA